MEAVAQIIPLILIVAVFWLLIVRPARKKQQSMNRIRSSVAVGDSVLLGSGLYGDVKEVGDSDFRVEIAPGTVVRVHRDAVVSIERAAESTEEDQEQAGPSDAEG